MQATGSAEKLLHIISELAAELHPQAAGLQEITLDSELDRDLGLDSLARMELLSRLEKVYNIHLPEKVLTDAQTPRDVLHHLGSDAAASPQDILFEEKQPRQAIKPPSGRGAVPFADMASLLDVVEYQASRQPNSEHIVLLEETQEQRISFATLRRQSLRVAARLMEKQLTPGQTVAIMLPTSLDYFYTFLAVLYCGAIPVPLYPPARPTQIEEHIRRHRKIIANAGASMLVTISEVKAVGRLLKGQATVLQHIVTADDLYAEQPKPILPRQQGKDIAFLQYTSGSTGDPKGVVLSHYNLLTNIRAMGRACKVTPKDVFISWLPLYHDMGLIGAWFGSLCHGCLLVVMSPLSFLARPQRWLQAITRYGGTLSASPNFGYEICATRLGDEELEGLDLGSWRMAFNGAEPVIPDTLRRFSRRFIPYGFKEQALTPVYGLAESTVGLAFPDPDSGVRIDRVRRDDFAASGRAQPAAEDDSNALEFVCCGKPLPGHQLRVVDNHNRELPERREGRLQFSGPSSTAGYFRNPGESAPLFCGEWLETGDLAYIAGGEVYLTSRQKDVIFRAGRNIYPHELEEIIGNIEGVRKGCTAVFASRKENETIEKLIVLTESRQKSTEEIEGLKETIRRKTIDVLGMAPDDILVGPPGTVLKTSSGKIRRSACRTLYESGHAGGKNAAVWLQLVRMGLAGAGPTMRRGMTSFLGLSYACYCWLIFSLSALALWCGVVLLPGKKHCWPLVSTASRLVCRLTGIGVSVDGRENIENDTPAILVSNHMSYLDSIVLTSVLPGPSNFVAKAELANNPLMRIALKKLDVFFVERFDAGQSVAAAEKIGAAVRHGAKPIFFAEGTLQRIPGLLPFQMGAFLLACEKQIPVVPLTIRGTRDILRSGSWYPRRGRIRISFAKPHTPSGKGWHDALKLRDEVRQVVLERLGEPDLSGEFTSIRQTEAGREHER